MLITNVRVTSNYDRTCTCRLNSSLQISPSLIRNGIVYTSIDAKLPVYLACSVTFGVNAPSSTLSIPNYLLKKIHLKPDDFITLSIIDPSTVPLLSTVSLDVSSFDLDVFRSNETELEQGFLLQCSFVYVGMQLPVWCGGQLVYCAVDNFHPISIDSRFGRLGVNTTLHLDCRQHGLGSVGRAVALGNGLATTETVQAERPPTAAVSVVRDCDGTAKPAWLPNVIWLLANFICRWLLGYGLSLGQLLRLRAACRRCVGRLTEGPVGASPISGFQRPLLLQVRPVAEASDLIAEPNCALVSPRHLAPASESDSAGADTRWRLVQVQPLGPREASAGQADNSNAGPLLLKLLPCESVPPHCLRLTPASAAALGLACGCWVRLLKPHLFESGGDATSALISSCLRLKELRLSRGSSADALQATRQAMDEFIKSRSAKNPVVILHNRRLDFTDANGLRHACFTELVFQSSAAATQQPQQLPCALLCSELGPRLSVFTANSASSAVESTENASVSDQPDEADDSGELPDWLADALEPLVSVLARQFTLVAGPSRSSFLALLRDDGGAGQGKTALLRRFANRLRQRGCFAGDLVDCRRLARLEFASAHRRLWRMARLTAARAPACLLLDNLDAACAPVEDGLVGTGAEVHLIRLCHMIRSLLKWIRHQPGVMLIATAGGPLNNQLIDSAAGQCLFDLDRRLDIRVPPTDSMRRLLMLSGDSTGNCLTLGEYARCSCILEYCSPEAAARISLEVTLGAVRQARDECDPARARLPLEYDEIRGLDAAKSVLERAIVWPLRFPRLVQRVRGVVADNGGGVAPAGVLLTGPSGCGKSLLVRALARKLRLRLLAVRGPELLSKFVGASERAVRDLFAKARRLRPCMVFLDEVDALAPRRGNDSTGVTDRVVNQLLTELDGLDTDGLAGVALLAATNRPDLVDPALLRPGRIGLRAVCQLPDRLDRRNIVASLLTADGFADCDDFDALLDRLADSTEGYCSADFNALLLAAAAQADGGRCYGRLELIDALDKVRPSMLNSGGEAAANALLRPGQRLMFA